MNYATFYQRFAAMWIDFFVFLPLIVVEAWLQSISRVAAIVLVLPMSAAFCAYTIYCHGRFGQTVGKHAMGIRVVRTTGERIGWREAWLRSSVDVALAALGAISSFVALAAINDAEYYGVGWTQRATNLQAHQPAWLAWALVASQIWVWSEMVVMLFNKRRRALHDFIAGTVVTAEQTISDTHSEMTNAIRYRDLQFHEAKLLGAIDRSERIDAIYRATDGILELEETRQEVTSWDGAELAAYIARLETIIDSGGRAFAAWNGHRLVGIGSLDTSGVGSDSAVMKLDMLYVSAEYRGRGIGRRLTEMAASQARALGATGLYISATPTRGTVDAYLRMGANVLRSPDPEMLAREPDDIHLVLNLARLELFGKETS